MALTFANKVTVGRILIVPFFIIAILSYSLEREYLRWVAFGIFLVAIISDVIDGYIARTRKQKTRAGAILDPLADKLLLISAFICLYSMDVYWGDVRFPVWLVVAVISRDVILLLGAMIIYLVHRELTITPTRWGKATAFFQVMSILGVFFQWKFSYMFWYTAIVLTVISAIDYTRRGIKVLNDHN